MPTVSSPAIESLLSRLAKVIRRSFPKVLFASSNPREDLDEDMPDFEVVFVYRRGNSTDDQQLALLIGHGEEESTAGDFRFERLLHQAFLCLVDECDKQDDILLSGLNNLCSILEGRGAFASRSYDGAEALAQYVDNDSFDNYFTFEWVATSVYASNRLESLGDYDAAPCWKAKSKFRGLEKADSDDEDIESCNDSDRVVCVDTRRKCSGKVSKELKAALCQKEWHPTPLVLPKEVKKKSRL